MGNHPTNPQALVCGLTGGEKYDYQLYQYALHCAGTNGFTPPGGSEVMTTANLDLLTPTYEGEFTAPGNGEALFQFRRMSSPCGHIHFSKLAICRDTPATTTTTTSTTTLAQQVRSMIDPGGLVSIQHGL